MKVSRVRTEFSEFRFKNETGKNESDHNVRFEYLGSIIQKNEKILEVAAIKLDLVG